MNELKEIACIIHKSIKNIIEQCDSIEKPAGVDNKTYKQVLNIIRMHSNNIIRDSLLLGESIIPEKTSNNDLALKAPELLNVIKLLEDLCRIALNYSNTQKANKTEYYASSLFFCLDDLDGHLSWLSRVKKEDWKEGMNTPLNQLYESGKKHLL